MPTLDWLNRDAAFQIARQVPYRLLEQVSEHLPTRTAEGLAPSPLVGEGGGEGAVAEQQRLLFAPPSPSPLKEEGLKPSATQDNLLIQGDNLEALKSLLPFYRGQVKCIFIDPPYNTKSAFEHYDDNLEHAQWLTMMLPRLQLLRELLREDGSIWVTIDDNEGHYLKVLMDEVFGRGNFVANVVWQKRFSPNSTAIHLSDSHDHVLVFARSKPQFVRNLLPRNEKSDSIYKNLDNDVRGVWTSSDLSARNFYSLGTYPITTPSGRVIAGPPPGRYWAISEATLAELRSDNRIWWGAKQDGQPRLKRFLTDVMDGVVPQTIWEFESVGHTQEAKKEVVAIFGSDVFGTPKPERLIQRILHIATNPNDLILDSFLGSGTTTAVAQKMGRRWIGIEMGEHAQTHCVPRLQKVLDGEQGGISKAVNWQGGGSFRFMRLGAPIFDDSGTIHAEVKFATLAAFVWMQETRTPWGSQSTRPATSTTPSPQPSPARGEGAKLSSPYLGTRDGVAYYLLFNGILGDRRPQGGNVLTSTILAWLNQTYPHPQAGSPRVIYGESVRLGPARLAAENITFKQIPYDVARG